MLRKYFLFAVSLFLFFKSTTISAIDYVYVVNSDSNSVSLINPSTNAVDITLPVGEAPQDIAFSKDGSKVYITNNGDNTVSVINTSTGKQDALIPVGTQPFGIVVDPSNGNIYVTNNGSNSVSEILAGTNTVNQTFNLSTSRNPADIIVNPDGSGLLINSAGTVFKLALPSKSESGGFNTGSTFFHGLSTIDSLNARTIFGIELSSNKIVSYDNRGTAGHYNPGSLLDDPKGLAVKPGVNELFIISGATNTVVVADATNLSSMIGIIDLTPSGSPRESKGLTFNPDGSRLYVTNFDTNNVSIINTGSFSVEATVNVQHGPLGVAFGPGPNPKASPSNGSSGGSSDFLTISVKPKKNSFFTETTLFNLISWNIPGIDVTPTYYKIFRDNTLIATIPAEEKNVFEDHNLQKNTSYSYFVIAENESGTIATSDTVTIKTN